MISLFSLFRSIFRLMIKIIERHITSDFSIFRRLFPANYLVFWRLHIHFFSFSSMIFTKFLLKIWMFKVSLIIFCGGSLFITFYCRREVALDSNQRFNLIFNFLSFGMDARFPNTAVCDHGEYWSYFFMISSKLLINGTTIRVFCSFISYPNLMDYLRKYLSRLDFHGELFSNDVVAKPRNQ